uniref:Orcokinin n=1 Tax=Panagrolaimus sp. JU765 TaxID=591449 RepID=A0AC34Q861_9BILA
MKIQTKSKFTKRGASDSWRLSTNKKKNRLFKLLVIVKKNSEKMKTIGLIVVMIAAQFGITLVQAYPSFLLMHPPTETRQLSKRAFDRLDMSAFDFGSLSKRYDGDDDVDNEYFRNKKAFDRIDESNFGFGLKKRAFDRLENSAFDFGGKRSETDRLKRPFDRLDSSNFGILKKRTITQLSKENDLEPFFVH